MRKSPQTHREEEEKGQLTALGLPWGTRPILGKVCEDEEAPEFLIRSQNGEGKNRTLSLLKAEVWGAYNLKCKNTGEPPQKCRGKSRDSLREGSQAEELLRWNPAHSSCLPRSWELVKLQVQGPSQAAGSSPSQAGRPSPGHSRAERPPGMEGPSC